MVWLQTCLMPWLSWAVPPRGGVVQQEKTVLLRLAMLRPNPPSNWRVRFSRDVRCLNRDGFGPLLMIVFISLAGSNPQKRRASEYLRSEADRKQKSLDI